MVPSSSRVSHQLNLFGNSIPKDWCHVILNCQVDNEDEPAQNMDLSVLPISWSQPLDNYVTVFSLAFSL